MLLGAHAGGCHLREHSVEKLRVGLESHRQLDAEIKLVGGWDFVKAL
jgi:hypothetical protein